MKKMAAGVFKAKCLAVMDEVQSNRETVVITKHGKPVAKLVPINTDTGEIFHFLAGKASIAGDVVSPALTPDCRHLSDSHDLVSFVFVLSTLCPAPVPVEDPDTVGTRSGRSPCPLL